MHERIVAAAANRFIVIIDSSKLVDRLGSFPLPVEVFPFGWRNVLTPLQRLGFQPSRREFNQRPVVTEEGNYIIDCEFPHYDNSNSACSTCNFATFPVSRITDCFSA